MSRRGEASEPVRTRRLSGAETALWYGLAGVTYIGASIFHKFLLNWFVGPLWLVAVVWAGPALVDRLRGRHGDAT
jgi:energy-converting hydrogenase Eha subunit G